MDMKCKKCGKLVLRRNDGLCANCYGEYYDEKFGLVKPNVVIGVEEDLKKFYEYCNKKYFDDTLPKDITVGWNNRTTKRAGRCYSKRKFIEISSKFHSNFPIQEVEDTLVHEMIHLLHKGHGIGFQREAQRINDKFLMNIQAKYNLKELEDKYGVKVPIVYRWEYTCLGCGNTFKTKRRRSINCSVPPVYMCAKCEYGKTEKVQVFEERKLE